MINLFSFQQQDGEGKKTNEFKSIFKYGEIKEGDSFLNIGMNNNHLLFLKEGLIRIDCDEFIGRELKEHECVLIPKSTNVSCKVIEPGSLLVFVFDTLQHPFESYILQSYKTVQTKIEYAFEPAPIREPLVLCLDLIVYYQQMGINHDHLNELKERELFLLLRSCYSQEEIVTLLYPIIGSTNFKNFILKNAHRVKNVAEFVRISGMGRTAFDYTFRNVFGTSARQWMIQQTAKQVKFKAMEPEITIKDLMKEFKFNSASQFNHFCRKQFDCTPRELIQNSGDYHKI